MTQHTPPAELKTLRLLRKQGIVRPRELASIGVHRTQLQRLVREGLVEQVSRGIYTLANYEPSPDVAVAIVAKRVPEAVICLLTALRLHGLTTQQPREVWIALPEKARKPELDYPPVRVARFSGAALSDGIEHRKVDGVSVAIYSAAKTVADCFKYRNKIGVDIAVEALRDYTRRERGGADALARYAKICRVSKVIQPYLDSLP